MSVIPTLNILAIIIFRLVLVLVLETENIDAVVFSNNKCLEAYQIMFKIT